MKNITGVFFSWLPFAVSIVLIYGGLYFCLQQHTRLSVDEILVQYAENTRDKLLSGQPPAQAVSTLEPEDMGKSLSPYVIVYNDSGISVASSTTKQGGLPAPPAGVLVYAQKNGQNRRTWQPEYGGRMAIVVLPYNINGKNGFVLAGRSLREAERMEEILHNQVTIAAIITLLAAYLAVFIRQFTRKYSAT
jgi:hypothetical protein